MVVTTTSPSYYYHHHIMSSQLEDKTFPLSKSNLHQITHNQFDYYGESTELQRFIDDAQKTLSECVFELEKSKEINQENVEEDMENTRSDSHLTPDEIEQRIKRSTIIDEGLNNLFTCYKSLVDVKVQNRFLSESARSCAREYKFPPGFNEVNENNIEDMKADNFSIMMAQKYNELAEHYNSLPKYKKYGEDSQNYLDMREKAWKIHHESDMPNINKEYSDYEEEEEDMVVEETRESFKCPLTKQYYESPVTSKTCGHSFSSAAIFEVIDNSESSKIKCPVPACSHYFGKPDLVSNSDLERRTGLAKRREQREHDKQNQDVDRI